MIKKYILILFSLPILFYQVPKFYHKQTGGFTIANIRSQIPYNSDWEVSNPPLESIFEQRFTFLGTGGQCFAFCSEDGQYVIKFFKHHLRRLPLWLKILPLPAKWAQKRQMQKEKRLKKLHRDFRSYVLAFTYLPDETGLLYLHLNKTKDLHKKIRLVDKLGIEHRIPLDQFDFILQKRATLAFEHLRQLIEKQDVLSAKEAIRSICSLILCRCEKGIHDEDPSIHRNFGFVGNQAILIDVGRLKLDLDRKKSSIQIQDLYKITGKLKAFLEKLSPELANYLQNYLEEKTHA